MSEIKTIALALFLLSLTVLIVIYCIEKAHEPDFVSPETVEFTYLDRGYTAEDAKAIREMCETRGCSVDENGKILVNQN